jgi:hypothetical protein
MHHLQDAKDQPYLSRLGANHARFVNNSERFSSHFGINVHTTNANTAKKKPARQWGRSNAGGTGPQGDADRWNRWKRKLTITNAARSVQPFIAAAFWRRHSAVPVELRHARREMLSSNFESLTFRNTLL